MIPNAFLHSMAVLGTFSFSLFVKKTFNRVKRQAIWWPSSAPIHIQTTIIIIQWLLMIINDSHSHVQSTPIHTHIRFIYQQYLHVDMKYAFKRFTFHPYRVYANFHTKARHKSMNLNSNYESVCFDGFSLHIFFSFTLFFCATHFTMWKKSETTIGKKKLCRGARDWWWFE